MTGTMHGHFAALSEVQDAIAGGDLELAQTRASQLTVRLANADHPEGWEPDLGRLRRAAWAAHRARDLATAADAIARAAGACGTCHARLGAQTRAASAAPDVARPSELSELMFRHLWANNELWNGLVGPSDTAWNDGAAAFAEAGLFPAGEVETSAEMDALVGRLTELGGLATRASGQDERAAAYGQILATCAGCHSARAESVD
jgi:cytochrome c553